MYTIDFILPFVNDAGKELKNKEIAVYPGEWVSGFRDMDYYEKLPCFNPIYEETIKHHNKIAVHSTIDLFPFALLKSKAPNQSEVEWKYQMGIYESITNSTWDRAKSKTKIGTNTQNYSINWKNDDHKKYFYEDYPAYHSVEAYFMDIVRDRKIDFPNQCLLVRPNEIPGEFIEGELGLEFKPNQAVEVDPICVIIEEEKIIQYKDNDYLLVLSDEKSKYIAGGMEKDDGLVMEFYDKDNIWKFIQVGVDEKYYPVFDSFLMYEHNWGWLPARKLGGKPIMHKNQLMYHSIFIDAVPTLNTVVRLWSNLIMSYFSNAFPRMMIVVDDCTYVTSDGQACDAGYVWDSASMQKAICPRCNGTGDNVQDGPTGIYKVRNSRGLKGNELALTPPIQFADPNPAILKEGREYCKELMDSAFSFMQKTEQASNKTATGEMLDEQDFQSMLVHFFGELFDLMGFSIEAMGWYKWPGSFEKPEIKDPTYFNFKTPEGITEELGKANENNLPDSYKKPLVKEAASTRFNSDEHAIWEIDLQTKIDRLWSKSELEVAAIVGRTCTKSEAILHTSFTTILSRCIEDLNGVDAFKALDLDKQSELMFAKADEIRAKIEAEAPKLPSVADMVA